MCALVIFLNRVEKSYPAQHKVVPIVLRTVLDVGFLIIQFLAIKLWVRIPLQIEDSPSALLLYLCVNFHKCVSVAF